MTMKKISERLLYWTPRILTILYILFLAVFSLDIFDENLGFWGTILGLIIHNIPSLVLLALLLISWKRALFGAIAFSLSGIAVAILVFSKQPGAFTLLLSVIMAMPALVVGSLFAWGWRNESALKKNK